MPDGVEIQDGTFQKVYVIVDQEIHRRAMRALRQRADLEAIREGVPQMEAGDGQLLHDAEAERRQELGFPPRA